ncbi:MAG: molybdopterin-dependent oxidoreductase [Myxococcota bacterium]
MTTHHTFCRICEASCGLRVDVDDGRVTRIRPDAEHVGTSGFACTKGLHQHELYDSPDRLRHPMKRADDGSVASVSWRTAMDDIGRRVAEIRREHGPDAIAMYVGTAAGFSVLHPIFAQGFMTAVGSRSMYSSATQDCANKFAVSRWMYGFPFLQPFPDVESTRCLIIVGANPVVSKWSFLQVSNPGDRLKAIRRRGGTVVVVDPRRTETAKVADEHVFIRPDSDAFFYLGFLHEVLARGAFDRDRIQAHMKGFDAVQALARAWSPERCASATGIDPDVLRRLVTIYLEATEAGGAALYCSTGVNMGRNGSIAFWLQEVINAVSGNLDRAGGTLVGQGAIDLPAFGAKRGLLMRPDRSRVGDFLSVNDTFPGGVLADEIETPGTGRVRALFVTGGNPLLTMANSARLRKAFGQLDLLVTLDIFPSETGSVAHYQLPCTSPLERPDIPALFPFMLGLQSRPYVQATRALVEPPGEARDEASIYLDLCRAAGLPIFGSRVAQRALQLLSRRRGQPYATLPQETLLSVMLRLAREGSFERLLREPHGRRRKVAQADFLGGRVQTGDGRVDLAPEALLQQAAGLDAVLERTQRETTGLKLITKRAVTSHNSWTHNAKRFVAGRGRDTNYLYMHPDDARARALEEGAWVDVRSATGHLRVSIKLLDDLMPGVVALPHGWGHQASGMGVAGKTRGVNVNILAADGPDNLEPVSGMAHLTGIPVEVRAADGPADTRSWSGLPDGRG